MSFISGDNKQKTISKFLGINRRESSQDGEMLKAINICADEYPCLKTVKAPKKLTMTDTDSKTITNIRAAIVPGGKYDGTFTGVAGTSFYYKNKKIPFYADASIPETGDVLLTENNGNIIICCYNNFNDRCLLFYNYNGYAKESESTSIGYVVRCDCAQFLSSNKISFKTLPAAASYNSETTYRFYGDAKLYFSNFKVGDSIVIDNLLSKYNEKYGYTSYEYARETLIRESRFQSAGKEDEVVCLVTDVNVQPNGKMSTMDYTAYNIDGEIVPPKGYHEFSFNDEGHRIGASNLSGAVIRKAMPIMNSVCIHNNRLWGVNPNGEYIYSSKTGDFREFNRYEGLSSDSYYVSIGTGGNFVGIYPYRNYVLAFKKDCIYIISGTLPTNYTISRTIEGFGCIDIKSCSICGGNLYFLSENGFYRFDGLSFELISKKLNHKYVSATGFGTTNKYYAYARRDDGQNELLVFDEVYSVWHTISTPEPIHGFFSDLGDVYGVGSKAVYLFENEENTDWTMESVNFFEDDCSNSYINEIWIRAKIAYGKKIDITTNVDGIITYIHGKIIGTGRIKTYRIPVRWKNAKNYKIKLQGDGETVIYNIELHSADGGRQYKK